MFIPSACTPLLNTHPQSITFTDGICSNGNGISFGSVGGRPNNDLVNVIFQNSQVMNSQNGKLGSPPLQPSQELICPSQASASKPTKAQPAPCKTAPFPTSYCKISLLAPFLLPSSFLPAATDRGDTRASAS